MAVYKRLHLRRAGRFANAVGNINREKIRRRNKAVHGFKPDVVGIHVVGFLPAERLHGRIGLGAQAGRFGPDKVVFTVGFVPDGNEFRAERLRLNAGLQLRPTLMTKPVSHPKGKFIQPQKWIHKYLFERQAPIKRLQATLCSFAKLYEKYALPAKSIALMLAFAGAGAVTLLNFGMSPLIF